MYRVNTVLVVKLRVIVKPEAKNASGYAFRVKLKSYYETNDAGIEVASSNFILLATSCYHNCILYNMMKENDFLTYNFLYI